MNADWGSRSFCATSPFSLAHLDWVPGVRLPRHRSREVCPDYGLRLITTFMKNPG